MTIPNAAGFKQALEDALKSAGFQHVLMVKTDFGDLRIACRDARGRQYGATTRDFTAAGAQDILGRFEQQRALA